MENIADQNTIGFLMNNFKIYALFNKATKKLVSFTFDISPFPENILNTLLIREYSFEELGLTDENINLNRFKWIGDYEDGKLIDIVKEKKSIVTEKEINERYSNLFYEKFKFEEVLYELILNSDMKTEKGKSIQKFLEKLLTRKHNDVEYYKSSDLHIWESEEDVKKRQIDAFKL
jgi:hypothetical protein